MSVLANRRLIVGRKIVAIDHRPLSDGKGGIAHDPVITLDNGAELFCVTEETEVGSYGTALMYSGPGDWKRPPPGRRYVVEIQIPEEWTEVGYPTLTHRGIHELLKRGGDDTVKILEMDE